MNDDDLQTLVRSTAPEARLEVSAEDVLRRGDRLRRRRYARRFGGAAAGALALGLVVSWPPGAHQQSPEANDEVVLAGWSSKPISISSDELERIDPLCRRELRGVQDSDAGRVVGADIRGDLAQVVYDNFATCTAERHNGTWNVEAATSGGDSDLGNDAFAPVVGFTGPEQSGDGLPGGGGVFEVSDQVASMEVEVGGRRVAPAINGGAAFYHLPKGVTAAEHDKAVATAYDKDGKVLQREKVSP